MKISNPKAKYGDIVEVLNYRCNPARWEKGECRGVSYGCNFGNSFSWKYDVFVRKGKNFFLYVNDSGIRKST